MGYSEILCQICGVSFNIGRIRTMNEPQEMAWDELGVSQGRYVTTSHFSETECPPGCMVTLRKLEEPATYLQKGYADPADGDGPTAAITPAGSAEMFYPECLDPAPEDGIDRRFRGIGITHALEHIAGPECRYKGWAGGGYNGNNISVEEMRGCTTSQCLVPKDENDGWESEDDDEGFEKEGKFFLSGLSDEMPSRDSTSPTVFPGRHDCCEPGAENQIWAEVSDYAIPFHPTCLEVFKRASLHRSGKVDYEALELWWEVEGTEGDFWAFPRDPAVVEGSEQWWQHSSGDEWLVANTCYMPDLEDLLDAVQRQVTDPTVESTATGSAGGPPAGPGDVFAQLPQELRTMIAVELDMTDTAALRVASRSFWDLPQAVARALMIRQRPWLWEAWSSLDYSFWTTATASELKAADESHGQQMEALEGQLKEARKDDGSSSGLDRERIEQDIAALQEARRRKGSSAPVTLLDTGKTNWFMLRKEIMARVRGGKLKGLRNRERVWKDCNEILDRAERYRQEGKI